MVRVHSDLSWNVSTLLRKTSSVTLPFVTVHGSLRSSISIKVTWILYICINVYIQSSEILNKCVRHCSSPASSKRQMRKYLKMVFISLEIWRTNTQIHREAVNAPFYDVAVLFSSWVCHLSVCGVKLTCILKKRLRCKLRAINNTGHLVKADIIYTITQMWIMIELNMKLIIMHVVNPVASQRESHGFESTIWPCLSLSLHVLCVITTLASPVNCCF